MNPVPIILTALVPVAVLIFAFCFLRRRKTEKIEIFSVDTFIEKYLSAIISSVAPKTKIIQGIKPMFVYFENDYCVAIEIKRHYTYPEDESLEETIKWTTYNELLKYKTVTIGGKKYNFRVLVVTHHLDEDMREYIDTEGVDEVGEYFRSINEEVTSFIVRLLSICLSKKHIGQYVVGKCDIRTDNKLFTYRTLPVDKNISQFGRLYVKHDGNETVFKQKYEPESLDETTPSDNDEDSDNEESLDEPSDDEDSQKGESSKEVSHEETSEESPDDTSDNDALEEEYDNLLKDLDLKKLIYGAAE